MRFTLFMALVAGARWTTAQIVTETRTQNALTATGATLLATGATVTFTFDVSTVTVSIGSGTTVTLSTTSESIPPNPSSTAAPSQPAVSQPPANATVCQEYADPDILGLGVRLGLYFQLFSNLLILFRSPDEALVSITVTNVFLTGIFVAVINSVAHGKATPGELIVIMSFSILEVNEAIGIFAGAYEAAKTHVEINFWNLWLIAFKFMAYNTFYLWFWFHGLTLPNPRQCGEPRVFFFANFGAYGKIRTLFKIFFVFSAVLTVYLVGYFVYIVVKKSVEEKPWVKKWKVRVKKPFKNFGSYDWRVEERLNRVGIGAWMFALLPAPFWVMNSFASLLFGILTMELEIRWNNFEGINTISSSGEIIPLVIGCFSLFMSLALLLGGRAENAGAVAKQTEEAERVEQGETEAGESGEDHV